MRKFLDSIFENKPSMPLCIVATIVFAPIGLWLLYMNLTFDKTKLEQNSRVTKMYGFLVIAVCSVCFLLVPGAAMSSPEENATYFMNISLAVAMFSGSTLFFGNARKLHELGERQLQYAKLLENPDMCNLEKLAEAVNMPYRELIVEMKSLLEMGFYPEAKIDENKKTITL